MPPGVTLGVATPSTVTAIVTGTGWIDSRGDLVDLSCNRRDCHRFDGSALTALVDDMKAVAKRRRCLNGGALGRHRKRRRR